MIVENEALIIVQQAADIVQVENNLGAGCAQSVEVEERGKDNPLRVQTPETIASNICTDVGDAVKVV